MSTSAMKELLLEGLDCANCGMKIESRVSDLEGVSHASLNLITNVLRFDLDSGYDGNDIMNHIHKIVKDLEPHVVVKEKIKAENHQRTVDHEHDHNHSHSHSHDHGHSHDHSGMFNVGNGFDQKMKGMVIRFAIAAVFFAAALILNLPRWAEFSLFFISYCLSGGDVVLQAVKNIGKGDLFDENFLMSIATIGAFAIGEFAEGVAVMLFFQVGEFFQSLAINRSRSSIAALMDIRPDYANLKIGDETKKVSPNEVRVDDIIIVKPGEKVPLDGVIIEGSSMVDTTALTGESVLRSMKAGDSILGGFINKNGLLTIKVTKEFSESTVSKILDLVQNASSKKAPTENFITKFAKHYTPVVTMAAVIIAIIPPLVIPGAEFTDWLYRALVFLVISCPCALVISIPLSFFGGIGGASKSGILIKGSNYLEALNHVENVVFDKTGTLTKGVFKVTQIKPSMNLSKEELLEYAALAESYSNHPIAESIMKEYGKGIDKKSVKDYEEIMGHGVKIDFEGRIILAGNGKLMEREGVSYDETVEWGTIVHIAIDGSYVGYIVIDDEVKEDSRKAIKELKSLGIQKITMLTGDRKAVGEKIAGELGLDDVHTELLPHEKVEILELIEQQKSEKGKIVFVGDGINDAPVLARADIGVAMGGLGSDAAIEAADVVLMTDEPHKLVTALKIAKKTRSIVWQNIIFALGVKLIVLALGAGGIATMWEAVFADVGVALIAILNAIRVMKVERYI